MRFKSLMLWCCLLACSLVSANTVEKDGLGLEANPTEAPLMHSTVKPTKAPNTVAQTTKPMIINVPPKAGNGDTVVEKMPELKPKPLDNSTKAVKTETFDTDLRASDAKPVQVTGFITKNGNIYEVQNKDGIGMIEGRQNPANDNTNVCNYGSIVIYSDVPCEEVTNIRVGDVVQTTLKDEMLQNTANNQNTQEPNQQSYGHNDDGDDDDDNNNYNNNSLDHELDDIDDDMFEKPAPVRRPNQNRRRVKQNKNKRQRNKNKNKNRKSNHVNSNQVNRRRTPVQKNRKRKNQQQNRRRRLQNQNQQHHVAYRRQPNSENRIRPNQHRRRTRKGNGNGNKNGNVSGSGNDNGSNGSRRGNTNRNGSSNRRRLNQRSKYQSKRRQHETANDRRRFDEDDDY